MKAETKYKDILLKFRLKEHTKEDHKMIMHFTLNETRYENGTLLPVNASEERHNREYKKLVKWAKTVIDENLV
jgi:hypothetical protein